MIFNPFEQFEVVFLLGPLYYFSGVLKKEEFIFNGELLPFFEYDYSFFSHYLWEREIYFSSKILYSFFSFLSNMESLLFSNYNYVFCIDFNGYEWSLTVREQESNQMIFDHWFSFYEKIVFHSMFYMNLIYYFQFFLEKILFFFLTTSFFFNMIYFFFFFFFIILIFFFFFFFFRSHVFSIYKDSWIRKMFVNFYTFIYSLVENYLGEETDKYFIFTFFLFFFLNISNLCGLIPFGFAITSHLAVTLFFSTLVWFTLVLKGFDYYGLKFFNLFYASGTPFLLIPFLCIIEFISFVFRAISLALRLFANLVAGHILLDTISIVVYKLIHPSFFTFTGLPLVFFGLFFCFILFCFEIVVAFLQSYIFVVLTLIYFKDLYSSH